MVTQKSAKTKLDPKTFSFNSVMARVKPPSNVTASIFLMDQADLEEATKRIAELDRYLDAAEAGEPADPKIERAIGDPDPLIAWLAERNELAEQVNASELVFEFRAKKRVDQINALAAMHRDQVSEDDDETNGASVCYVMAECCTNAGWTGAEWLQFRDEIGEAKFLPLTVKAISANIDQGVSAPFLLRSLPTRINGST